MIPEAGEVSYSSFVGTVDLEGVVTSIQLWTITVLRNQRNVMWLALTEVGCSY